MHIYYSGQFNLCNKDFLCYLYLEQILESNFKETKERLKGIYLHGGVGTGKTLLLDMFYDCLPQHHKRRVHFHSFMLYLYSEINRWNLCLEEDVAMVSPTEHIARSILKVWYLTASFYCPFLRYMKWLTIWRVEMIFRLIHGFNGQSMASFYILLLMRIIMMMAIINCFVILLVDGRRRTRDLISSQNICRMLLLLWLHLFLAFSQFWLSNPLNANFLIQKLPIVAEYKKLMKERKKKAQNRLKVINRL